MAVSKRAKIILTLIAAPFLVVFALILFLKFYFTSERLKALLIPRIESAVNREVTVSRMSLSIFPILGVNVEKLSIANPSGMGFSERPMVGVDRFLVDVRFLPLLARRLEVERFIFYRPRVFLEVNEAGITNFSSPANESGKGKNKTGFSVRYEEGTALLLSNFEIKDGEFEYADRVKKKALGLKGINTRLRIETIPQVREMRMETEVDVADFTYGDIHRPLIRILSLSLNQISVIHLEEKKLTIERGELRIQEVPLAIYGSITAVEEEPVLDLVLRSDNVHLRRILSLVPRELLKETANAEIDGDAKFQGSIRGGLAGKPPLDISLDADLTNGRIHYAKLPKAITQIQFKAVLASTAAGDKLEVKDFSARLGDNPVRVKLALDNFRDPAVDVHVEGVLNLSQVKDFYPLESGKELSGSLKARLSLKGKASTPALLRGSGVLELQDVAVRSADAPVSRFNGVVAVNNQVIEAKQLKVQYGVSDLSLSFLLRNYLPAILPAAAQKGAAVKPSMTVSIQSSYFESIPSKEPIVLPPFDVDATLAISKFVYKGKEPFECTDLRGTVTSSESTLRIKSLSLQALSGSMNVSGAIGLQKPERPQFDIKTEIEDVDGHALLKRFTSLGQHLFGKFSVSVALKGELNDTLGFVPQSLSGDGNVQFTEGRLTGYPVMERLASFLELPDLREVHFKSWSNAFKISGGKVSLPDLKIGARGTDFLLAGWHGLDGSLDYALTIKLSESLANRFMAGGVAAQVGNLFKDKDGRVTLFLLVGGTTEAPKFRWDTKAAQEKLREKVAEEIEKKKDEMRDKAREEVQKKVDEGKKKVEEELKKLLKKR